MTESACAAANLAKCRLVIAVALIRSHPACELTRIDPNYRPIRGNGEIREREGGKCILITRWKGAKPFLFGQSGVFFLLRQSAVCESGENCVSAQEHLIKKIVQTLMMFSDKVFRRPARSFFTGCCSTSTPAAAFRPRQARGRDSLAPAGGVHVQRARLTIICIRRFAHGIFKLHASERLLFS